MEETDGTGFRDWFNDQNRITEGNLKRTVRLLKFLRDHKGNFSIPSVILTALAGEAIRPDDDGADAVSAMADTVATVLTRIDERLEKCDQIPVMVNPANPSLTFNTHWEDNQYQNFRRLMGVYASTARQARDEIDKAKSIAAWQKLFGEDFKLRSNSNAGQDRNTGSSSGPGANAGAQQRATPASGASASVLVQPRKQYGGVLEGTGSRVATREVSPADLEQLAERHPQLAYDAETNVLSGNLRVQASYRPGRGLNINISRREGDRMHVEDDFAIEIQLTHGKSALAPWPPVYETGGRAQQIMGEQGVGIADLHFFDERADVNHCCLSLQNTDEWRGIVPFIDELVAPFFYRLAYAARYGVERAESDLWGTYHHGDGFEGAKRQYEAELLSYKKQNHGPNKPCPCRNGRKYRHCHKGEVDQLLALPAAGSIGLRGLPHRPPFTADMAPPKAAQERPQRGWRLDHAADGAGRPAGAQHVGVVNAVAPSQRRRNQGQHLVSGVRPPRRSSEVNVTVDAFTHTQELGEGYRKEQPSIGHQAVVVEGDLDAVGVLQW